MQSGISKHSTWEWGNWHLEDWRSGIARLEAGIVSMYCRGAYELGKEWLPLRAI